MVFTSISFLFIFLPAALGIYFFVSLGKNRNAQNLALLLISAVFYAWSGVGACLLLFASAIVNFFLGCHMEADNPGRKKAFIITLIFNLSILGFFKYFNFLAGNIEFLITRFVPAFHIDAPVIPLPVGISFFTFQILSYQIDVYRGNVRPQRKMSSLMLYIMLFPQLIAGPIVRYIDVESELTCRHTSWALFEDGIRRLIIGFSKKVLLADRMGYLTAQIFADGKIPAGPYIWLGLIFYSMQIYLDFSAYSDMAIGLGHIFGFHFMENFNYPFISASIKEFWNRWHISLSSWFRDYVYFPLGGSRKGPLITYRNIIIIFLLTGLWHGAGWTFVVWGLIHGVFLCLERAGLDKLLKRLPVFLRHLYVLTVFVVSIVFFYNDSFPTALHYLKGMFSLSPAGMKDIAVLSLFDRENIFFTVCSVLACTPLAKTFMEKKGDISEALCNLALAAVFILAVCYRMSSGFNPFIYFRF